MQVAPRSVAARSPLTAPMPSEVDGRAAALAAAGGGGRPQATRPSEWSPPPDSPSHTSSRGALAVAGAAHAAHAQPAGAQLAGEYWLFSPFVVIRQSIHSGLWVELGIS